MQIAISTHNKWKILSNWAITVTVCGVCIRKNANGGSRERIYHINNTLQPNHPLKICEIWQKSVVFEPNTTDFSKSVVFESNTTDLSESVVSDSNTTDFSETRLSCILSLSCAIVSSSLSFWLSFCLSPHLLFSLQRDVQRSQSL